MSQLYREGKGRELLAAIASNRRDAVAQALDQGCTLEVATGSGGHGFKLVLPDGHKLPLAAKSGKAGGGDRVIQEAFKNDLRRFGMVIDGVSTSRGTADGVPRKRVSTPRKRAQVFDVPELSAALQQSLRYGDEIIDAVTQLTLRNKFEAIMPEIVRHVGRAIDIGSGTDREPTERRIEREVGELVAHGHILTRVTAQGQALYWPPGFQRPPLSWEAGAAKGPPAAVAPLQSESPPAEAPIAGGVQALDPPADYRSPSIEPALTHVRSATLPGKLALSRGAWAALGDALEALVTFCRVMTDETDETTNSKEGP